MHDRRAEAHDGRLLTAMRIRGAAHHRDGLIRQLACAQSGHAGSMNARSWPTDTAKRVGALNMYAFP
jgi:hypothetical protein